METYNHFQQIMAELNYQVNNPDKSKTQVIEDITLKNLKDIFGI